VRGNLGFPQRKGSQGKPRFPCEEEGAEEYCEGGVFGEEWVVNFVGVCVGLNNMLCYNKILFYVIYLFSNADSLDKIVMNSVFLYHKNALSTMICASYKGSNISITIKINCFCFISG
jgi:hypothetical protein